MATSSDKNLDHWTKSAHEPVSPAAPADAAYDAWDPFGWLEGDTYYTMSGGKPGRPLQGQGADDKLAVSWARSCTTRRPAWTCTRTSPAPISSSGVGQAGAGVHQPTAWGRRYYVGQWKDEQFRPEVHERISWADNAYFAPESCQGSDGRRILWAWIFDNACGSHPHGRRWSARWACREGDAGAGQPPAVPADRGARLCLRDDEKGAAGPGGGRRRRHAAGRCARRHHRGADRAATPGGREAVRHQGPPLALAAKNRTPVYYDAAAKKLAIDTGKSSSSGER